MNIDKLESVKVRLLPTLRGSDQIISIKVGIQLSVKVRPLPTLRGSDQIRSVKVGIQHKIPPYDLLMLHRMEKLKDKIHTNYLRGNMKQKVKDVMPVFETQIDITIVEEDGSYFFYMDHEMIEEVNIRGKITLWYFTEKVCHSFDISKADLVDNKYKISRRTVEHEKYPINNPFPVYRSFQRPPLDY